MYHQDALIYQEQYFNPDCVVLFKDGFVWFDLSYALVGAVNGVRKHFPCSRKVEKYFAFHSLFNRLSVLSNGKIQESSQDDYSYKYIISDEYSPVNDIDKIFRGENKIKIKVKFRNFDVIFPVRLLYKQNGVYSFCSKDIAIPALDDDYFSWRTGNVGNISVTNTGECSIFRRKNGLFKKYEIENIKCGVEVLKND